jgi:hypothetical protein
MLALVSTSPIFGEAWVPRPVKVAVAVMLTFVIAPTIGALPAVAVVSAEGGWIIVQQVLIGAAMGFSMKLVFTAVLAAGEYIGLQMGLSFASFFDPMSRRQHHGGVAPAEHAGHADLPGAGRPPADGERAGRELRHAAHLAGPDGLGRLDVPGAGRSATSSPAG